MRACKHTNLKGDGLVRLGSDKHVLPVLVWRLHFLYGVGSNRADTLSTMELLHNLFERRHEPVTRHNVVDNLRIVDLEQEAVLPGLRVALLGHC